MRKLFGYPVILFLFVMLLTACGSNTEEAASSDEKQDTETEEGTNNEVNGEEVSQAGTITELQEVEATDVEAGNLDVVDIEKGADPRNYPFTFANNGLLILENQDRKLFYDYLEGTAASLTTSLEDLQSDAERGNISAYNTSFTALYDDTYYFITSVQVGESMGNRENKLLELNMESKEITEVVPEESFTTLAKNDDVLFVGTSERIYAVDLETKEILWETDSGISSSWIPRFHTTANSLIFTSMETTEVYSQETGELIYEEEGFIYDVASDGEMFYALENISDGYGDEEVQIGAYHETDGKQEALTEPVVIDDRYDEDEVTLELKNNRFFIKMEHGIVAFDAQTYEHLWTNAYGKIEDSRDTGDDYRYRIHTDYSDDFVYMYTDAVGGASDETKNLFTVMDASTGEVTEHINLGDGVATGPFLDEAAGKVMIYYVEKDHAAAYMQDIK